MSRIDDALRRAAANPSLGSAHAARILRESASRLLEVGSSSTSLEGYPRENAQPSGLPAFQRELSTSSVAPPPPGVTKVLATLSAEVEGKAVTHTETPKSSIEQYRRLAASLHQMRVHGGLRTLMVSSALPRDGKTLTAVNLALTLSESYRRRVLLIDADLRRPSIHEVFQLSNAIGLAEGLRSEASGVLPLIHVSPRLAVLPSGRPDDTPMAGLTSERMRMIINEAASDFDWTILDTPPVGLMSDANLLAGLVDGVLLVIGAGSTDYQTVKRTITELGSSRIVGVVLNRVHDTVASSNYDHYHDYSTKSSSIVS